MKKRTIWLLALLLAVLCVLPPLSAAANETDVGTWQALKTALEEPSSEASSAIVLSGDIDAGSSFTSLRVAGNKTLDLAGYTVTATDGAHEASSILIEIPAGASLTVTDTTGGGGIRFAGALTPVGDPYTVSLTRDLFLVSGTLHLMGGRFEAGNLRRLAVENAADLSAPATPFHGNACEVVRGSVITVKSGGTLTVSGGELVGRYNECVKGFPGAAVNILDGKLVGTCGGGIFALDQSTQITVRAGEFDLEPCGRILCADAQNGSRTVDQKEGVIGIPARAMEGTANAVFLKNNRIAFNRDTALASLMTSSDSWTVSPDSSGAAVTLLTDTGAGGTVTYSKGSGMKLVISGFTPYFPQGTLGDGRQDLYVEWQVAKVSADKTTVSTTVDWTVLADRAGMSAALSSLSPAWETDCCYYVRARVTEKWNGKYILRSLTPALTVSVSKETVVCTHDFEVLTDTTSCTAPGVRITRCTKCGTVERTETEQGEVHLWEYVWDEVKCWRKCTRCGAEERTEGGEIAAKEHKFKLKKSTVTCTNRSELYACTVCGYEKRVETEISAHSYDGSAIFREENNHFWWCSLCGEKHSESHEWTEEGGYLHCAVCGYYINLLHDMVNGGSITIPAVVCPHSVITVDLSGLTEAQKEREKRIFWYTTAGDGGQTRIGTGETIDLSQAADLSGWAGYSIRCEVSLEGLFGEERLTASAVIASSISVPLRAPTCISDGNVAYERCNLCGKCFDGNGRKLSDVTLPRTGEHIYSDECDRFCDACGKARTAPHVFDPVPSGDSSVHYLVCTKCGAHGEITAHTAGEWIIQTEVSCVSKGKQQLRCTVCDRILADVTLPASAHRFDTTKTTRPSCTAAGQLVVACTFCGERSTSALPAHGHSLIAIGGTLPSCLVNGTRETWLCVECGASFLDADAETPLVPDGDLIGTDPSAHVGAVSGDYLYDAKTHRLVCACGAELEAGAHTLNASGICTVCGYLEDSLTPAESEKEPEEKKEKDYKALTIVLWIIAATLFCGLCVTCYFLWKRIKQQKAREEAMKRLANKRRHPVSRP